MKNTAVLIFTSALILFSTCQSKSFKEADLTSDKSYKVVGYFAAWKGLELEDIPAEKLTHLNYAFANVVDGVVTSGEGVEERDSIYFSELQKLKLRNPDLKILVSIGGWTWSKGFSDAALTPESRNKLTASGVDFLIKHNLDGLDFDWEYPALQGDNNVVREEDKENFVEMLKSFREALDSIGKQDNTHYLMTIASGGFRTYLEVNDLKAASEYLDFINIMAYDFYTAGDETTGHHANLFPNGTKGRSASNAVKEHLEFGVPAEKIVLGVPFYGRMWQQVEPTDHGLFQSGKFKRGLPNSEIQELMNDSTYIRYWDEKAAAPYIYSKRDSAWITYEDEESMVRKMDFIKENGLGGAMFWELSEDPSRVLLNTMYRQLNSESEN